MTVRLSTFLAVLAVLAFTAPVRAQQALADRSPTGLNVGAFAGLGSGPIDAGAVGTEARLRLASHIAFTAEYSLWGNGWGSTSCAGTSHRCSVDGWAWLAGAAITVPIDPLELYAAAAGGLFNRDWLDGEVITSWAQSLEAGSRVRLYRRLSARFRIRSLRTYDDDYRELEGEDLRYTMGILGLEYAIFR